MNMKTAIIMSRKKYHKKNGLLEGSYRVIQSSKLNYRAAVKNELSTGHDNLLGSFFVSFFLSLL